MSTKNGIIISFYIIVCVHSFQFISLHRLKDNRITKKGFTNLEKKGKKIMVTMVILAIVAITIAQAVNMGHKIDMK